MPERLARSRFFLKIFEIIVPVSTWVLITLPLWLSPFHPAVVAYFIIAFDLYFFYKSYTTVYYAVLSYMTIKRFQKVPFYKKITALKKAKGIMHFVIMPTYQEPIYKLESTINALVNNDYPYKNIYLVLAFEKRESEALDKAEKLMKKYKNKFAKIILTYHELIDKEAAGKASNQTHSAKMVDEYVAANQIRRENTILTICDADSHLPKNYFSYLTFEYLRDKDHLYHFYWAPVLLYNNFSSLPFFVRMQATLSSILRMAFLSQEKKLIQISMVTQRFPMKRPEKFSQ